MRRMRVVRVMGAACALAVCAWAPCGAADEESLAARDLRGYGLTRAARHGNVTVVTAETPEKALLWAARYDHVYAAHRVRPGIYRLPGGGWTKIGIEGREFRVAYSADEPRGSFAGRLPDVPFYLNAWDDHAFRFYYRERMTPRREDGTGDVPWAQYDPLPEFDFARDHGEAGLVHWANGHFCDTAKGLDDRSQWLWSKRLAESRGLPVILNTNASTPTGVLDDFREEQETGAPDYLGGYHGIGTAWHLGEPFVSWASERGRGAILDTLAACLRANNSSNVVDFLEPHGELSHGEFTVFIEHGPLVDASYRKYLKERYGTVAAVAARWQDASVKSWADVRLPEIAEFAGFGPDAIDLKGTWRYRPVGSTGEWGRVEMPGHALAAFLPTEPAVFRRAFTLPPNVKPDTRTWLYVWDLSPKMGDRIAVRLNGATYESFAAHGSNHWMVREVTDALRPGANGVELTLPFGKCCYKVYLTHEEPRAYPYFGKGKNARWIDFCGWQEWSRAKAVRAGLDRLRAVEPDKGIVSMAPMTYLTPLREIAAEYGARFHDTGGMAAFWWELLPMLMRSKGLPFSLEPGGPARDREGFRRMTNFYMSEGVNAIHYFIHIGCVSWNAEIAAEYDRRLPALKMLGRMTPPESELAMVVDSNVNMLMGYPWRTDVASAYPSGYMTWRFAATLGDSCQLDAVTPCDFADGNAANYRFLLDANNTIMDAETVAGIERYVRGGGTYVAMFQSGRHTPLVPDRWALKGLAGVEPAAMSAYATEADANGIPRIVCKGPFAQVRREGGCGAPPDVPDTFRADGVRYRATDPSVETVWRWEDGSPAVTVRRVGKGRFVSFGIRPHSLYEGVEWRALRQLLKDLGVREKPIAMTGGRGFARHYVTNDGLHDVWYADTERGGDYAVSFRDGKAREATDVLTGKPMAMKGHFADNDFVMGTSPRGANERAAWHWVKSQFGWWQGGPRARRAAAPQPAEPRHPDVLPLTDGWRTTDGTATAVAPRVVGLDAAPTAYMLSRTFTVPKDWTDGDVELWAVGMYPGGFAAGELAVRLDGQEIRRRMRTGLTGLALPVKAGETHVLELDVTKDEHPRVRGFGGPIYLYRRPRPERTLDLSGEWDALTDFTGSAVRSVSLPGDYAGVLAFRRRVAVPADWKSLRVRIDFTSRGDRLVGVIVNGRYVRRHHHRFGDRTDLDITPFVRFGDENELILVGNDNPRQKGLVEHVRLTARTAKGR